MTHADRDRAVELAKEYNLKAYHGGAIPAWMVERDFLAGYDAGRASRDGEFKILEERIKELENGRAARCQAEWSCAKN